MSNLMIRNNMLTKYDLKNYILIILYIFFMSDNTVLFGTNQNQMFARVAQLCIYVIGLGLLIFLVNGEKVSKVNILFLSIVLVCLLFSLMINSDAKIGSYIYVCFLFFASYLITSRIKFNDFIFCYDNVIYFFSVVSILGTLLFKLVPSVIQHFPVIGVGDYDFYNMLIWITPTDFNYEFRNYGIFREPGVFQVYLILALIIQFYSLRTDYKRVIVYSICLLLTKSTTGYILYGLLLVFYLFSSKTKIYVKVILFILGTIVTLIIIKSELSAEENAYSVFGKINMTNISFLTRIVTVLADVHIFKNNPLFGVGISGQYKLMPVVTRDVYHLELKIDTNTIVQQFASFGLIYGSIWVYSLVKFSKRFSKNFFQVIGIFIILILALLNENFIYSILIYILFWYGININLDRKGVKK